MANDFEPGQSLAEDASRDLNEDGKVDFKDAVIHAELTTGDGAESVQKAWHHGIYRLARMSLGFTVFIIGIIMLPAPGPGGLVVASGLAILARDVKWADRLLRYLRKKMPGMAEEGPIPKSTIIISVMLMAAAFFVFWWSAKQPWYPF